MKTKVVPVNQSQAGPNMGLREDFQAAIINMWTGVKKILKEKYGLNEWIDRKISTMKWKLTEGTKEKG